MLKARFDTEKLSVKIGTRFSEFGLSATTWTLMAFIPAFFGFLSIYSGDLFSALILFALAGAIDAVDGAVARVTGTASELGAFLDGVVDRYVELFIYLGLLFYLLPLDVVAYLPTSFWIAFLVFGAMMPSFVTAYAHHRDVVTDREDHRRMAGLLERGERLSLLYLGMLLGLFDTRYLLYMVALVALLANFTALQRIFFVLGYKSEVSK